MNVWVYHDQPVIVARLVACGAPVVGGGDGFEKVPKSVGTVEVGLKMLQVIEAASPLMRQQNAPGLQYLPLLQQSPPRG